MAKYKKEDIPNLDLDTLFKVGMNLANKIIGNKIGGMTWDDLPDTNSLWDHISEGMSGNDFIQGVNDAVDERLSEMEDDMSLFENNSSLNRIEKLKKNVDKVFIEDDGPNAKKMVIMFLDSSVAVVQPSWTAKRVFSINSLRGSDADELVRLFNNSNYYYHEIWKDYEPLAKQENLMENKNTVQITTSKLQQIIKEGVAKIHKKTLVENRIKEINEELSQLNDIPENSEDYTQQPGYVHENVMADKNYTHFAIYKPTEQIMNAWNYADVDPEDLRLEPKLYFMTDIQDMFPEYGIKVKDISILTRRGVDKKGLDPEDIKNWYRPWDKEKNQTIDVNESVDDNESMFIITIQVKGRWQETITILSEDSHYFEVYHQFANGKESKVNYGFHSLEDAIDWVKSDYLPNYDSHEIINIQGKDSYKYKFDDMISEAEDYMKNKKTVQITTSKLQQIIKEGVTKLHKKTLVENRIKQINEELKSLSEVFYGGSDGDYDLDKSTELESQELYDRGLELFNQGDTTGAEELRQQALSKGSWLGWGEAEFPPYTNNSTEENTPLNPEDYTQQLGYISENEDSWTTATINISELDDFIDYLDDWNLQYEAPINSGNGEVIIRHEKETEDVINQMNYQDDSERLNNMDDLSNYSIEESSEVASPVMINTINGYLEAVLWTEEEELGPSNIEADVSFEAKVDAYTDIKKFKQLAGELIAQSGLDDEQIGHDLWLTRNGHGAGFWDRGLGEIGDQLTEIAEAMGSKFVYRGDDGLIYID